MRVLLVHRAKTLFKASFCGILYLLLACAPATPPQNLLQSDVAVKQQWLNQSTDVFLLGRTPISVVDYADSLATWLAIVPANDTNVDTTMSQAQSALALTRLLSDKALFDDGINPARLDRLNTQIQMLIAHQFSLLGQLFLHPDDEQFVASSITWLQYVESLTDLVTQYPLLSYGNVEIYYANDQEQLLAYRKTLNDEQAFVAFNFSFESQPMPLPFGFMASTKVTVWESDIMRAQTFVTNQPLVIRPLTSMMVIVE